MLGNNNFDKVSDKMKVALKFVTAAIEDYSLLICYIVLLFVGLLDTLSLFSLFYLTFLFICIAVHNVTHRARSFIKGMWKFRWTFSVVVDNDEIYDWGERESSWKVLNRI